MTSLEIAEVTSKQHCHVMAAIRKMEPAWQKVNQSNFRLVDYQDKKGELRPCYQLTKTECLYIATKFNDEARARLILRWEQLELQELKRKQQLALPSPKKILALADDIIGSGLRMLNEPAEDTLTTSTPFCATWAYSTAATGAGTFQTICKGEALLPSARMYHTA